MRSVQGHHGLYKAPTGAVINTDKQAYQRALERKKEKQKQAELEGRLERIESLLERLLNGK